MKYLGLVLLAATAQAQQIPDAPKPLALNIGAAERFNLTKQKFEVSPSITLDYRFSPVYRVGITYSHDMLADNNTVTGFLNVKILQWGDWKRWSKP